MKPIEKIKQQHPAVQIMILAGSVAAAIMSCLALLNQFTDYTPIFGPQAQYEEALTRIDTIEEKQLEDREEELGRWKRSDMKDKYLLEQRHEEIVAEDPEKAEMIQQQIIILDEGIKEYDEEQKSIREKRKK